MHVCRGVGESTQLMPYASSDRWAAGGTGAVNGALHLIYEQLDVQAMQTSWALFASNGQGVQERHSQTNKGPHKKEVAKGHSPKAVPTCTQ